MAEISQTREIPGADSCHPHPPPRALSSLLDLSGLGGCARHEAFPGAGLLAVGLSQRGPILKWSPPAQAEPEPLQPFQPSLMAPLPPSPGPPQGQLPEVSLNPYVGFGSSCFWLHSAAGDLRGGCVICTAVIRVIA